MDNLILKIDNISKSFPRVKANKNVTFNIKRNTVHALLGENGAGKSTFVKILYGLLKPDEGKILSMITFLMSNLHLRQGKKK